MPSKSTIAALSAFHGALQPIRAGIMKESMSVAQPDAPIRGAGPLASRPVDTGLNRRLQPRRSRISNK